MLILAKESLDVRSLVHECHVNFWQINGFLGRTGFFLDIGICIERIPSPSGVRSRSIYIGVPFNLAATNFEDLSISIKNPSIAVLIFARGSILEGDRLTLPQSGKVAQIVGVTVRKADLSYNPGTDGRYKLGYWKIEIEEGAANEPLVYLRVRFITWDECLCWSWKRAFAQRLGANLDFQVNNFRALACLSPQELQNEQRLVSIVNLNCFAIVPSKLEHTFASPTLRYVRSLEAATQWEDYLGRKLQVWGHPQYLVYQWEHRMDNGSHPFSGYLSLNRTPISVPPSFYMMTTSLLIAAIAIMLLLSIFPGSFRDVVVNTVDEYVTPNVAAWV